MADARVRDQASPRRTRRVTVAVLACWVALSGAELFGLAGGPLAAAIGNRIVVGAVVPEVLIALAAVSVLVTLRGSRAAVTAVPLAVAPAPG
jgi:hypothetical protein